VPDWLVGSVSSFEFPVSSFFFGFGLNLVDGVVGELAVEVFEELLGYGFFAGLFVAFAARGDGAEGWVFYDFFDHFGGLGGGVGLGEIEAGDLQAVEEQTRAARVDFVGRDALQDLRNGGLDGRTVFEVGENELLAVELAVLDFLNWDWAARIVVVVAKFFSAKAERAATEAVGEDVAAVKAHRFRVGLCVVHVCPSPRGFGAKCLIDGT